MKKDIVIKSGIIPPKIKNSKNLKFFFWRKKMTKKKVIVNNIKKYVDGICFDKNEANKKIGTKNQNLP